MLRFCLVVLCLISSQAMADAPVIESVKVSQSGGLWRFDVTLAHGDTGWDHYADAWRVLDPQGNELGRRNLAHPHVDEQPFTRSLSGVEIPAGISEVSIQARDNLTGWASSTRTVKLR